jgi:nitric oxide reductase NorE protein
MVVDRTTLLQERSTVRKVPAEGGIWVFVALDVLVFAWMFGIFAYSRAGDSEAFRSAHAAITPAFGLAYTVLLLTSSWCVVTAISAFKSSDHVLAERFITWGIRLGAAFAVLKLVEYSVKFAGGYRPVTNEFLMFYFVLTFVHLMHACAGLIALGFVRSRIRSAVAGDGRGSALDVQHVEAVGIFWHMVDLLWIFLFALFYLGG